MGRRKSRSRAAVAETAKPRVKTNAERPRAKHDRAATPAKAAHAANSRKPVTRPAPDVTRDTSINLAFDMTPDDTRDMAHDVAPDDAHDVEREVAHDISHEISEDAPPLAPASLLPPVEWSAPPEAEPIAAPSVAPSLAPSLVPGEVPVTEPDIAPSLPEPPPQPAAQPRPRSPRDILAIALTVVALMIVCAGWLAVYIEMVPPPVPVTLVEPAAPPPPPSKEFTERLAPPAFADIDMNGTIAPATAKAKANTKAKTKAVDNAAPASPVVVLPRVAEPLPPPANSKTARAKAKRHKARN